MAERGGDLVAVLPDGAVFDLFDAFGHALTNEVINRFALRPVAEHTPRVTIDRMVVSRETWRIPGAAHSCEPVVVVAEVTLAELVDAIGAGARAVLRRRELSADRLVR